MAAGGERPQAQAHAQAQAGERPQAQAQAQAQAGERPRAQAQAQAQAGERPRAQAGAHALADSFVYGRTFAFTGDGAGQGGAHVFIISGLGGERRWSDEFFEWGATLATAAVERYGVPEENIIWLAERADRDPRIRDRSTAVNVAAAFRELARRVPADGQLLVILMGHGAYDGHESKINLPGPDPTAADFAGWLDAFATQRVAIINTTSASGGWIEKLAKPNRAVITATRSGMERNEAVFGRFFVRAYTEDVADIDKDGRVSLLEAFDYARAEVERFYTSQNRIQTERALIDDSGRGQGVPAIEQADGTGALATSFFLGGGGGRAGAAGAAAAADASPELRALLAAKERLEREIAALRAARASMDPERYEEELERLLVELATTNRSIRQLEGGDS